MPTEQPMKLSSSELHNHACYTYLITLGDYLFPALQEYDALTDAELGQLQTKFPLDQYHAHVHYGQLYQLWMRGLEAAYERALTRSPRDDLELARLQGDAYLTYHNDNHLLTTYYQHLQPVLLNQTPRRAKPEERVRAHLSKKATQKHGVLSPYKAGSDVERLAATQAENYTPQHETSLPTIKHYAWQPESRTEYRMPTQGQRVRNTPRVSPLFQAFLNSDDIKPTQEGNAPPISYVYFNLLKRDQRKPTAQEQLFQEAAKECAMTAALETIESEHGYVSVITLPADGGLMDLACYKACGQGWPYLATRELFQQIVLEQRPLDFPCDFHISPEARALIFKGQDKKILTELLEHSFTAMGIDPNLTLSEATRQAVWFHFINFMLPEYILTQTRAKGFNFSCKDGIDRGGAASAWFNLINSFETSSPMDRDAFESALHAAPAAVKGRGMNDHLYRIWNAVDVLVDAHFDDFSKDPRKEWLIHWRNMNCPEARLKDVFLKSLAQGERLLSHLVSFNQSVIAARNLLNALENAGRDAPAPWMLAAASRTVHLLSAFQPGYQVDERELKEYGHMIEGLTDPKWSIVRGCMMIVFGVITASMERIQKGKELISMGFFNHDQRLNNNLQTIQGTPFPPSHYPKKRE